MEEDPDRAFHYMRHLLAVPVGFLKVKPKREIQGVSFVPIQICLLRFAWGILYLQKRTFTGSTPRGSPTRASEASEWDESKIAELLVQVPSCPWML